MTGFKSKRLAAVNGGWVAVAEPNFKVLDDAIVDGEQWYTVSCLRETSMWIRREFAQHEDKLWFQNIDERWHINFNVFDVHERLYMLLALRWSE